MSRSATKRARFDEAEDDDEKIIDDEQESEEEGEEEEGEEEEGEEEDSDDDDGEELPDGMAWAPPSVEAALKGKKRAAEDQAAREPAAKAAKAEPKAAAKPAAAAAKPAAAAAKPAPAAAAANAPFVAAKKFGGKKAGYVFKKGAQGVGYYADVNKPVPTIGKEATPLEARQMVVMASRITPPPQPQPLDRLICKFMPLLRPSLVARVLTKERDDAVDRAAAADKVAAEAQHKLELADSMETRRETAHAEHMRKVQKECANLQASVWVGNDRLKEAQEKLKVLQLKVLQLKEAQEKLLQLKMAQHQAEVEAHLETCAKLAAASARADACEAQLAVVNGQVARQDVPSKVHQ